MASSPADARPPPIVVDDDDDSIRRDYRSAGSVYPCMPSHSSDARNRHCHVHDTMAYKSIRRLHPDFRPTRVVAVTVCDRLKYTVERAILWCRSKQD